MARRRLPEGSFLDPIWGAQQKGLTIAGKGWKMVGDKLAPPVERQNLATDVSSGIGQLSGQIGLALLSGGLSIVAGIVVFTSPWWAIQLLFLLTAIGLILLGVVQLIRAFTFGKDVAV